MVVLLSFGILKSWSWLILRLGHTFFFCKFKFLKDNFVWGIIGVNGPNDGNLRFGLFDELKLFIS